MDGLYSMAISLNNMATNLRRPVALDIYDSFMGPGDKFCGGSEYSVAALQHLRSSFGSFPFLLNNNTSMPSSCIVSSHHQHSPPAPHSLIPDLVSSQLWQDNLPHISSCSSGDDDFIQPPVVIDGFIGTSGSPGITSRGEALGAVITHDPCQDSPTSSMGMSSNKRTSFPRVEKSSFSISNPCKILDHHGIAFNCTQRDQEEEGAHNFEALPSLEHVCLPGVSSNNTGHLPCAEINGSHSSVSPYKTLSYNENSPNSMKGQQVASNVSSAEMICSTGNPCQTLDFHGNVLNSVKGGGGEEEEEKKCYDCGGFSQLENIGLGDESLSTLLWESYVKNMQQQPPVAPVESLPSESSAHDVFRRELEEFDDFIESLKRMQESVGDQASSLAKKGRCVPASASRALGHATSFWDPILSGNRDAFGSTITNECKEGMGTSSLRGGAVPMQRPEYPQEKQAKLQKFDSDEDTKGTTSCGFHSTPTPLQQSPWSVALHQTGSREPTSSREVPARAGKKRCRSGDNPRPRPKDRQQIQDCVLELRNIIPSSKKCSIDALLEKTIKYINFLQTVTVKWKEIIKLQGGAKGMGGGASWAVELGEDGNTCPIIVENLSQPGHLLVEILCEQEGIALEIPDSIRKMGLTILKGVMEMRNNKLWANFVVEADREVHRVEVLWSLMQLFESGDAKASPNVANSR